MTMVVGQELGERGGAALQLGALLARSASESLVVGAVVPAPWLPGMARIDAEYREYVNLVADQTLDRARTEVPADVEATYLRHHARSVPVGLLELAERHDASLLVLGSSSGGSFGQIVLGSVTDWLLHSSSVPIALAPRGFRSSRPARVLRVTVAYGGSVPESFVVAAAAIAARVGASLRIASFGVWRRPAYTMTLGTDREEGVLEEWMDTVQKAVEGALAHLHDPRREVETVVGRGETWPDAMDDIDWRQGDVLVLGSSERASFTQVFLGSRAAKILRFSPVPVIVLPRRRAEEIAVRAAGSERS